VVPLAVTTAKVEAAAEGYVEALSRPGRVAEAQAQGDHPGRRLFDLLVPTDLWRTLRGVRTLYVVPHGAIHRVPLEALPVGTSARGTTYWVDEGPAIAYVPSASVLAWLRGQRTESAARLSFVAVGDPEFGDRAEAVPWPDTGLVVVSVDETGQAARLGLRPGDVLQEYGGRPLRDVKSLADAIAAGAGGEGADLQVVRETERLVLRAAPGRLGVRLAEEPPPVSGPRLAASAPGLATARGGALSRSLSPLPGSRREVGAIAHAFRTASKDARVVILLGGDATEARLQREARGARYLHLATHGLVDENDSASFSSLALTAPRVPVPGDDGFLTLVDLLERWRGLLVGTDLVVLSACRTQRGPLQHDEGVFALTLGFALAGCPSAVASLWKADDDSTPLLMAELYAALLSGGAPSKPEALARAVRALRVSHPDPYHWAPFVYVGDAR
jgi:CHAT domain-containing protein